MVVSLGFQPQSGVREPTLLQKLQNRKKRKDALRIFLLIYDFWVKLVWQRLQVTVTTPVPRGRRSHALQPGQRKYLYCLRSRKAVFLILRQHRTIAEASAVESPIRQETIGFPAHFFARAHNFKPPGRACQPEADSPMRT